MKQHYIAPAILHIALQVEGALLTGSGGEGPNNDKTIPFDDTPTDNPDAAGRSWEISPLVE